MGIANILTLLRMLLVPAVVVSYYTGFWGHLVATIFFGLAAITDWVDGYLARNLQQETRFGAFLDPLADKLLVITALLLIVGELGNSLVTIPAIVIVGRELSIAGLREWLAKSGSGTELKVDFSAKLKTTIQMVAVTLLLLYHSAWPGDFNLYFLGFGIYLLYLAAVMTLWSMIKYFCSVWLTLVRS